MAKKLNNKIAIFHEDKVYFIPESEIKKYIKEKDKFTDEEIETIKADFHGFKAKNLF